MLNLHLLYIGAIASDRKALLFSNFRHLPFQIPSATNEKAFWQKNGASESEARVNVVHSSSLDVVGFQIPSTTNEKAIWEKATLFFPTGKRERKNGASASEAQGKRSLPSLLK